MKPAAFLFDLDGTLIDSEVLWAKAIVEFLADRGAESSLREVAEIVFGHSWFDIDTILHDRFPQIGATSPAEDAVTLRPYYERQCNDPKSIIIPSSMEFLRKASKVAPCAIVSGSPHEDILIAAANAGVSDCLAAVFGAEDYARGKPAPDGYLTAARGLKADPARCIVVEDSTSGVASGLAAGMKVIGLERNQFVVQNTNGATWKVKDLAELDPSELEV